VLQEIRNRYQENLPLALFLSLAGVGVLVFVPYTLYRTFTANWTMAAVDFAIVVADVASMIYVWRTNNVNLASAVMAYVNCVFCFIALHLLGQVALYWFFPILTANFFLVKRNHAVLIMLLASGILVVQGAFPDVLTAITFVTASALLCFFAYIFSYRSGEHRVRLEALVTKDTLTGVLNRRAFQQAVDHAHHNRLRLGTQVGLLVIDVDHFKHVNDTWGHKAGDEVLVRLSRIVEGLIRSNDLLFRYGGEEFIVLASGADTQNLLRLAERICSQMPRQLQCHEKPVTVSIGAALLRPDETPAAWFSRADAALYRAKGLGRNCVVMDA
jgi:diguanylate cyclase (GGDEF)-like protein